jgi:hypothetical protein
MTRLDQELDRLRAFLIDCQPVLAWQTMHLVEGAEVSFAHNSLRIARATLRSPAAFARRFEELLQCGYSWINLNAAGIVDGELIVIVEVPRTSSGVPADRVAVNLSGPAPGGQVDLIEIEQP